jgi:hypothetical protein
LEKLQRCISRFLIADKDDKDKKFKTGIIGMSSKNKKVYYEDKKGNKKPMEAKDKKADKKVQKKFKKHRMYKKLTMKENDRKLTYGFGSEDFYYFTLCHDAEDVNYEYNDFQYKDFDKLD